jgi:hypothetical protein
MTAKMNVRYDPVPDEINTPLPPSPRPHADDTSSSTPFLPQQSPALDLGGILPTLPNLPPVELAPCTPAAPLPSSPSRPVLKPRHVCRTVITIQTCLNLFVFYLAVRIIGDYESTLIAWFVMGIVRTSIFLPLPIPYTSLMGAIPCTRSHYYSIKHVTYRTDWLYRL